MTESTHVSLLRRMTRSHLQETAVNPLTVSRAVRLALTKAANDTVGLALTVNSVAEEVTGLDDMLGTLGPDLMLVGLDRDGGLAGLIALDMEFRAAVLEMATMGAVLGRAPDDRPPTRTDKMLCDPLLDAFVGAFPTAVVGTPLDRWMDGIALGEKVDTARAAGLILEDRAYRIVRMNIDLGVADRQAQLVMALPVIDVPTEAEPQAPKRVDWATAFPQVVSASPTTLNAVLHRFPMSLAAARSLQVGSVIALPGCTVSSVRLVSPDGKEVAQAKLGQAGGYRAVRLEQHPALKLAELPASGGQIAMDTPMDATGGMMDGMIEGDIDMAGIEDALSNPADPLGMPEEMPDFGGMPADIDLS